MEISANNPNHNFVERVAKLVKSHHTRPENTDLDQNDKELLKILKDADCKSAAHERDDREAPIQSSGPYLEKISSHIYLGPKYNKGKGHEHFDTYPEREILKNSTLNHGYKNLDKELVKGISKLSMDNFHNFLDSSNSILRNTTSFIPSAFFYSKPNVPLYDHLKVSAALAMCIYRSKRDDNNEFMLIRTDLSGIQDYIFKYFRSEQADDKGTRRIRGRSLRVSLTTRAIVQYIVDELGLYDVNVIWLNSDGSMIMAPYSEENEKKLHKIRINVEKYLLDHDRGISCAIEWHIGHYKIIPTVVKDKYENGEDLDVEDSDFKSFMDALMNKINIRKREADLDIIKGTDNDFFLGNEIMPCWSCGLNEIHSDGKCIECEVEEKIGSKIVRNGQFICLKRDSHGDISFLFGNSSYSFSWEDIMMDDFKDTSRILYVNDYPDREKIKDFKIPWEIFMIGNQVPIENEKIVTINDMLKIKNPDGKNKNISEREYFYLGIFKADIDNMGTLISDGFPRFTFPAYASFSRHISIFFTIRANMIAKNNCIYLIYSGGDDISALGPIDKIINFSEEIHEDFKKWIGNDEITFSAGVATTHAKFPLRRGIEIAEGELKQSKSNVLNGKQKDSITLFGTKMFWNEFVNMNRIREKLKKNVMSEQDSNLGRSFMQTLIKLDERNPYKKSIVKGEDVMFPDHILHYYITRNWRGDESEMKNFISEMASECVYKFIRYPATYLIIDKRKRNLCIKMTKVLERIAEERV